MSRVPHDRLRVAPVCPGNICPSPMAHVVERTCDGLVAALPGLLLGVEAGG